MKKRTYMTRRDFEKMQKKSKKRRYKEHGHQVAIFQKAALYERKYPELELLQGSLTGVNLDPKVAKRAKDAGVKAGFPDINLPVARGHYLGLYIELKTDRGSLSAKQRKIMDLLTIQGHLVLMLKGHEEPFDVIIQYLEGKVTRQKITQQAPQSPQLKEKTPDEKTKARLPPDRVKEPVQAPLRTT